MEKETDGLYCISSGKFIIIYDTYQRIRYISFWLFGTPKIYLSLNNKPNETKLKHRTKHITHQDSYTVKLHLISFLFPMIKNCKFFLPSSLVWTTFYYFTRLITLLHTTLSIFRLLRCLFVWRRILIYDSNTTEALLTAIFFSVVEVRKNVLEGPHWQIPYYL